MNTVFHITTHIKIMQVSCWRDIMAMRGKVKSTAKDETLNSIFS